MYFLEELKYRNEVLYYFGLVCLVFAVACLVLSWLIPTQVLGTNAWYKPFKFFLSTTIFVWSMAWYLHYLNSPMAVLAYSLGMVVLFTIEDVYVLVQAARGLTSHFNTTSSFYSRMWTLMAGAAVGISLWTLVVSLPFFMRCFPDLPLAYLWGIRFGLIIFVIFSLQGMVMGARMAHTVGAADGTPGVPVLNWSKVNGDLRAAHFWGMHALQALPLLGFYLLRNTYWLVSVSILYMAFCILIFFQALAGKPFIKL